MCKHRKLILFGIMCVVEGRHIINTVGAGLPLVSGVHSFIFEDHENEIENQERDITICIW